MSPREILLLSPRTLRVSFILPGYTPLPIGGYRVVCEYANFLSSRGHRVNLIFPRDIARTRPPESLADAAKWRLWCARVRALNRPLVPWHRFHPAVRPMLVPMVGDHTIPDADIVVATSWPTAAPVCALSAVKGSKFYLIQHHETWAGPEREVNATWHLPLHKIVVSQWLESLGHRLGASDLRHIPNAIDLSRFRVTNDPEQRAMRILGLHHALPYKGLADLLAVLTMYHERYPHVPATLFGVEPRSREVPRWIEYVRNPAQETLVCDLYNRASVFLNASWSEGWALPPAEAMACGCVFVGTDSGGCRDFAVHGRTALLSPPRDRQQLLSNLIAVTEDSALRGRIRQNGTRLIRQFSWQRSGAALEQYFLETLTAPAAPELTVAARR